jgi:putative membrane protein
MRPAIEPGGKPVTESPSSTVAEAPPSASTLTQTHFSWLRTRLSIERTVMSWTRTAVSLIGFGFTIYQFLAKLERATVKPDAPRNFGLAFIATGIVTMAIGAWQRQVEIKHLSQPQYENIGTTPDLPRWQWSNAVAVIVVAIGLVAFVWIVSGG